MLQTYPMVFSIENFNTVSQEILRHYRCPLCQGILFNPIMDQCCHLFCESCFNIYIKEFKVCPFFQNPYDILIPKKMTCIAKIIDRQITKCPNLSLGCNWSGKVELIPKHLFNCIQTYISCLNHECKEELALNNLQEHYSVCKYTTKAVLSPNGTKHIPQAYIFTNEEKAIKVEYSNDQVTPLTVPIEEKRNMNELAIIKENYTSNNNVMIRSFLECNKIILEKMEKLEKQITNLQGDYINYKHSNTKDSVEHQFSSLLREDDKMPFENSESTIEEINLNKGEIQGAIKEEEEERSEKEESKEDQNNDNSHRKEEEKENSLNMTITLDDEDQEQEQEQEQQTNKQQIAVTTEKDDKSLIYSIKGCTFIFGDFQIKENQLSDFFYWKVHIQKITSWISFGVCIKEDLFANQNSFDPNDNRFVQGSYCFSSDGYFLNSQNKMKRIQDTTFPIIKTGDIISFRYNVLSQILFYKINKYSENPVPLSIKNKSCLIPCVILSKSSDKVLIE